MLRALLMTRIDQFESVFKASAKEVFTLDPIQFERGLVVTDLEPYEARLFGERVRLLLQALPAEMSWRDLGRFDE